jgi:hypothetical protein
MDAYLRTAISGQVARSATASELKGRGLSMKAGIAPYLEKASLALHFHVRNVTAGSAVEAPGNGPEHRDGKEMI